MTDLDDLRTLAEQVARAAGSLLRSGLGQARRDVQTKSSLTDMVSEMDKASELLIADQLLTARPADGIIGEEGAHRDSSSGVVWIVDPLDGTTNYLYGLPGFAVSIAAEREGVVVAGVVFDVIHDELFSATLGGGARLNGTPIAASEVTALPTALIATGFSYDSERRARQASVLTEVLPRIRDIRRFGAAAVDLCAVACGRVDGYYERGLFPWDLAAGALIATEAAAVVTDFAGRPARTDSVVAAAPGIAAELLKLVVAAGAADA